MARRHDFGLGLKSCSVCRSWCKNQGCGICSKRLCKKCFAVHVCVEQKGTHPPSSEGRDKQTPVHEQHQFLDMAKNQNLAAVKAMLLKNEALLNVQPSGRWSALHQFAEADETEAVKFLLSKGADLKAKTSDGKTPRDVAACKCKDVLRDAERVLEQHKFLDLAKNRDLSGVKTMILKNEALVNVQPSGRWSALHQFAEDGNIEAVNFLIRKGADPKTKNSDGKTPLDVATGECKDFLARDRNVLSPVVEQHKFLDLAKKRDFTSLKDMILKNEGLVSVQPCGRWSALHQFAAADHIEAVEFLLGKGADPYAKSSDGKTPLDVAIGKCKSILESGSKLGSTFAPSAHPFVAAIPVDEQHQFLDLAKSQDFAAVKDMILKNEELVNVQPCGRWSALHQFAAADHAEAVTFLLGKGADPNAKTKDGKNALDVSSGSCKDILESESDLGSTFAPSAPILAAKTFATSEFRKVYLPGCEITLESYDTHVLELIMNSASNKGVDVSAAPGLLSKLRSARPLGSPPLHMVAVSDWTNVAKLEHGGEEYGEFCSMVCEACREDEHPSIDHAAVFLASLQPAVVTRYLLSNEWPAKLQTTRGTSMPAEALEFFVVGKRYRCNMPLATSTLEMVSKEFMMVSADRNPSHVMVHFVLDISSKPLHARRFEGNVPGESEFFFAAYSCFKVMGFGAGDGYIEIELYAYPDNVSKGDDETYDSVSWELSPWH